MELRHIWLMGQYFGYPPCCIDDFIERMVGTLAMLPVQRDTCENGFVPCVNCATMLQLGKRKARVLIRKRWCKFAFSNDDDDDDERRDPDLDTVDFLSFVASQRCADDSHVSYHNDPGHDDGRARAHSC